MTNHVANLQLDGALKTLESLEEEDKLDNALLSLEGAEEKTPNLPVSALDTQAAQPGTQSPFELPEVRPGISAGDVGVGKIGESTMESRQLQFGAGMNLTFAGVRHRFLEGLEALGVDADPEAFAKATKEDLALFDKQFKEEFGESIFNDIARLGGITAPWLAMQTPATKTVKGAVTAGAAAGAAGGALAFDPETPFMANAAQGALLGMTVAGSIAGAKPLAQKILDVTGNKINSFVNKFVSSRIQKEISRSARLRAQEAKTKEIEEFFGISFAPFQRSDSVRRQSALTTVRQTFEGEEKFRNIIFRQFRDWENRWRNIVARIKSPGEFTSRIEGVFRKTVDNLVDLRKMEAIANYEKAAMAARSAAPEVNGRVIPLTNFINGLNSLIKRGATSLKDDDIQAGVSAAQMKSRLFKVLNLAQEKDVPKVLGPNGKPFPVAARDLDSEVFVNATQLQDLFEQFGIKAARTEQVFKDVSPSANARFAKRLFSELKKDQNHAISQSVPGAEELAVAREAYRQRSESIKALEKSAFGKIFGRTIEGELTPQEIAKRTLSMTPDQLHKSLSLLRKTDPDIHKSLQAFVLATKLGEASGGQVKGQLGRPPFSPGRMLELVRQLRGQGSFDIIWPKGDPMRKEVSLALDAMERLLTNNELKAASGMVPALKEAAGTTAGLARGQAGSTVFFFRQMAEVFVPRTLMKIALDEQGRKLIDQVAAAKTRPNLIAAITQLHVYAFDDREDPKDLLLGE